MTSRPSIRQTLKLTEFKYLQGLSSQRTRSSRIVTLPRTPAIDNKLALSPLKGNNASQMAPTYSNSSREQPQQSIFNRFRYENYSNYGYTEKRRYPRDRVLGQEKVALGLAGASKNLEIIYCQNKYEDFVRISNTLMSQMYQTSPDAIKKESKTQAKMKSLSRVKNNKYKQQRMLRVNSCGHLKAILSQGIMNQYQRLRKLTEAYQADHNLLKRYQQLYTNETHPLRLVLLQVLIHQHTFLRNLSKRPREVLFMSLLHVDKITPVTKISCTEYSQFVRLFVNCSADAKEMGVFVFRFLFHGGEVSLEAARGSLALLAGSVRVHGLVQGHLEGIFGEGEHEPEKILDKIQVNNSLLNSLMSLIVNPQ